MLRGSKPRVSCSVLVGAGRRNSLTREAKYWVVAGARPLEACGEPGLRGDGDLGAAVEDGVVDAVGGVLGGGGEDGGGGGEGEPAVLGGLVADEAGLDVGAGAHEAGADGGDADAFVAEFGVEAFGEADEGELAGDVGQQVGHGDLAADGGDVDDGGA